MNLEEFKGSLKKEIPPEKLNTLLLALWYDAKGDWEKSHDFIAEINTKEAALIHAYLHRKEGDLSNADYWYKRAGCDRPLISLEKEWDNLIHQFFNS
ncbi:MAG TPA: hypothetical protein VMZ69_07760 [Saprospiraceae bacterium]|nr:hypothetical protein [Saprospiraceae bacterium]